MSDVYVEYLVVKKSTAKDLLIKIGLYIAAFLIAAVSLVFLMPIGAGGLSLLLACGAFYGAYYVGSSRNQEYEYIVTNGEMDVDCIMARRKRKRLITVKVKDFEAIGVYKPEEHRNKTYQTRIMACDSEDSKNVWYVVVHHKTMGSTLVVFNATARTLEAFRTFMPRLLLNDFNRARMESGLMR